MPSLARSSFYRSLFLVVALFFLSSVAQATSSSLLGCWKNFRVENPQTNSVIWSGNEMSWVFQRNGRVKYYTNNINTRTKNYTVSGNKFTISDAKTGSFFKGTYYFQDANNLVLNGTDEKGNQLRSFYWKASAPEMHTFKNIAGNWIVSKTRNAVGFETTPNLSWTINADGTGNFAGKKAKLYLAGNQLTIVYQGETTALSTAFSLDINGMIIASPDTTYWLNKKEKMTIQRVGGYGVPVQGKINTGDAYLKVRQAPPTSIFGRWKLINTNTVWILNSDGTAVIDGEKCHLYAKNGEISLIPLSDPNSVYSGTYYIWAGHLRATLDGQEFELVK